MIDSPICDDKIDYCMMTQLDESVVVFTVIRGERFSDTVTEDVSG